MDAVGEATRRESPELSTSEFEDVTTTIPDLAVAGRYTGVMTDQWNAPIVPHGGVAVALALRAAETELARPDLSLRTVTAVFAAQVPSGPVVVDVNVLRQGRSASQVTATLRAADSEVGHHVVAVYGAQRPGFEFTDVLPPDVPPPVECRPFEPPPDADEWPPNFWGHLDGRIALGNHWNENDWEPNGSSERAYWYRFHETPRRDDGTVDPLALIAVCDTMPGAIWQRMGPNAPDAMAPSADLTVHLLQDAASDWILAHNRARHCGNGYASLEMTLWDPEIGLVAYGTQMMIFSFVDRVPTPDEVRPPV